MSTRQFTFATPEIKQASSDSVQFLRLRLDETDESESQDMSISTRDLLLPVLKRRLMNFLGLGVYKGEKK